MCSWETTFQEREEIKQQEPKQISRFHSTSFYRIYLAFILKYHWPTMRTMQPAITAGKKKNNNKRKQFKTPKFKFNYFDYHLVTGLIQLDWPLLVSAVRNVGRSLIIGRNWAAMQQRSREIPSGQSTRGSPQPPNSNDKWRLANQNKKREHVINYRRI